MAGYIGKGNWNEWETARALSLWLTNGTDKTQLIRSVMSGGSIALRSKAEFQVGDLAPNGEKGKEFRSYFGVECKHTFDQPEWSHIYKTKKLESWLVYQWWLKIKQECSSYKLEPLLIMKRNRAPWVVMLGSHLCHNVLSPILTLPPLGAAVIRLTDFTSVPPALWYQSVSTYRFGPTGALS